MTSDVPYQNWTLLPRDKEVPIRLPPPFYERYRNSDNYDPDEDLVAAVNVALLLGQPLLLTGEPGCGKTSLAFWLAHELGLGEPLVYNVKSTTSGRNLLYDFDELARFRDAQSQLPRPPATYLTLNAMGCAILFSGEPDEDLVLLDRRSFPSGLEESKLIPMSSSDGEFPHPKRHRELYRGDYPKQRRWVVLIDEMDKAPRDTPNDLLWEIERMEFSIPELRVGVKGRPENRPIVVITSNSEKTLPEPFLRRCVYHHIPSPDATRRRAIVAKQNAPFARREDLFKEAMEMFDRIHGRLGRRPGTAELLAWLEVLEGLVSRAQSSTGEPIAKLSDRPDILRASLRAIAKTEEDLRRAESELSAPSRKPA